MKKSWLVLILAPCLTFAAYPIYDDENENYEPEEKVQQRYRIRESKTAYEQKIQEKPQISESEAVHVQRYAPTAIEQAAVPEENANIEESVAYDKQVQSEEMIAVPQKNIKKEEPSKGYVEQKRIPRSSKAKSSSLKSKQSAALSKRAPVKKNGVVQKSGSTQSRAQHSRQNPNRPRVTHRNDLQNRASQSQIEADAQPDVRMDSHESNSVQANRSPNIRGNQSSRPASKKSAYAQKNSKIGSQHKSKEKVNRRSAKAYRDYSPAKSHHPGKRPASE